MVALLGLESLVLVSSFCLYFGLGVVLSSRSWVFILEVCGHGLSLKLCALGLQIST